MAMAPISEEDQVRVKALLTEAITVLCKDCLPYHSQLSIEGLLGVTIDRQDIFLVNINETIHSAEALKKESKKKSGKAAKRPAQTPPKQAKPKKPRSKQKRKDTPPSGYMKMGGLDIKQEDDDDYHQMGMDFGHGYQSYVTNVTPNVAPKRKTPKKAPQNDIILDEDTIVNVQRTILEQEGCVVLSRVLQRRKNKFKASALVQAMKNMSCNPSDRHYVGEYKEIGNIKLFYKCPPELLHADSLIPYSISPDTYTDLFYKDFKPNSSCPTDWASYVATLLSNTPYSPMLFPVDSMGLTQEEKKMLARKQLDRQKIFLEIVNTDSDGHEALMGHVEEEEVEEMGQDDVEDREEVIDTPGVALSLTIPASGSAEAVVGNMTGGINVHQNVHHSQDIVTDDCHEIIETETVIDDTLVMDHPDDYDSPT